MDKRIILLIVIVGLAALVLYLFGQSGVAFAFEDCGYNYTCFEPHTLDCSPAKVAQSSEVNTYLTEIKGKKNNFCEVSFKVIDVNKSSEYLNMFPDEIKEKASSMLGMKADCLFPMDSINFDPTNVSQYCEGELKDALQESGEMIKKYLIHLYDINPQCYKQTILDFDEVYYKILGIQYYGTQEVCRAQYSFEVPPLTGKFLVEHYFTNKTIDILIDYKEAPIAPKENFDKWCLSGHSWDYTSKKGIAIVSSITPWLDFNEEPFCSITVILEPISRNLPSAKATIIINKNTFTTIKIEASDGFEATKSYSPA